jgi:hypothetical protein
MIYKELLVDLDALFNELSQPLVRVYCCFFILKHSLDDLILSWGLVNLTNQLR